MRSEPALLQQFRIFRFVGASLDQLAQRMPLISASRDENDRESAIAVFGQVPGGGYKAREQRSNPLLLYFVSGREGSRQESAWGGAFPLESITFDRSRSIAQFNSQGTELESFDYSPTDDADGVLVVVVRPSVTLFDKRDKQTGQSFEINLAGVVERLGLSVAWTGASRCPRMATRLL